MRKILCLFFVLILACSLYAQTGRGSIYGKVVDSDGAPLPGVAVTLAGSMIAPVNIITGVKGLFRFMALVPAKDYSVSAELQGFKLTKIENIIVEFGRSADITVTLELGTLEEEITVTAERPLIDKKTTEVGMLHTEESMQDLPTSRDIFMLEKMTPGVYSRYWNIGGSESLQQDAGSARGDPDHYMTTYSMDGVSMVDMSNRGSSHILGYSNYDSIQETNIIVGGAADVTQQTSGLSTNVIMKRGSNIPIMGGRVFFSDQDFQWNNHTQELKDAGVDYMSSINETRDVGIYVGGPIIRDKLWYFLAWSAQEVKLYNVYGEPDNFKNWTYDFKFNWSPIPENRFEAYMFAQIKRAEGEDATPEKPDGDLVGSRSNLGSPVLMFTDEHMFGDNLFVNAKIVLVNVFRVAGGRRPMIDTERERLAYWNEAGRIWEESASGTGVQAGQGHSEQFHILADYFNDNLFGVAHEIRFGGSYSSYTSRGESGFVGNVMARYNYNSPTVDYDGDGSPDIYPGIQRIEVQRGSYSARTTKYLALFIQDRISLGKFNLSIGLRYDHQVPRIDPVDVLAVIKGNPAWENNFSSSAIDSIDQIIPAVERGTIKATDADGNAYSWTNISPRLSLTWDITGNGKNVLKIHAAKYNQWMGTGFGSSRWTPGGTGGWMHFWALDQNSNDIYELNELYWHRSSDYGLYRAFDDAGNLTGDLDDAAGIMYGSYDPLNPQALTAPFRLVDGETGAPRTLAFGITYEKALREDVAVAISTCYRVYDQWNQYLDYYPATGQIESSDWYMSAGTPPSSIEGIGSTGEGGQHEWYVLKPEFGYTPWSFEKPRPDYYINYYGVDFIFNKRLSNRWMLNASLTIGKQAAHFGDEGLVDPTQIWALEGRGTTGRGEGETVRSGRYDNPTWMFKTSGLYQLPWWDIDVSFTFNARQGRKIQEYFTIEDFSLPNPRSQDNRIWVKPYGTERSDDIYLINFRIQKRINFKDIGQITLSIDVYNVLNASTIHWRRTKDHGDYTVQGSVFSPNPGFYHAEDNFGPRILRFGLRLKF